MHLRKIIVLPIFKLTQTYFIWIAYISLIFLFTNALSSLDLIKQYRFTWDLFLTYGFLTFFTFIEAFFFGLLISTSQLVILRLLRINIGSFIRITLILALVLSIINLLLMVFNKPLFVYSL